MKVLELIEKLKDMESEHGNVQVKSYVKLTSEEPGVYFQPGSSVFDDEIQVFL